MVEGVGVEPGTHQLSPLLIIQAKNRQAGGLGHSPEVRAGAIDFDAALETYFETGDADGRRPWYWVRIACSSRPTVLTKYPLAQKCCPTKLRFLSP